MTMITWNLDVDVPLQPFMTTGLVANLVTSVSVDDRWSRGTKADLRAAVAPGFSALCSRVLASLANELPAFQRRFNCIL